MILFAFGQGKCLKPSPPARTSVITSWPNCPRPEDFTQLIGSVAENVNIHSTDLTRTLAPLIGS